jgi:hypothetical protein
MATTSGRESLPEPSEMALTPVEPALRSGSAGALPSLPKSSRVTSSPPDFSSPTAQFRSESPL